MNYNCKFIPEQFTVKVHPALFEGEGRGEPKNEALLFQSTVDIHFTNVHKTLFQSTVEKRAQNTKNCEGSHSMHLFHKVYIYYTNWFQHVSNFLSYVFIFYVILNRVKHLKW